MTRNQDIKSLLKQQDDDALKEILELLWSQEKGKTEIESYDSDDSLKVAVDWVKLQELALSPTPRERLQHWIRSSEGWLPSGVTVVTSIASVGLCWFAVTNLDRSALMERVLLGAAIFGLGSITLLMLLVGLAVLWTQLSARFKDREQFPGKGLRLRRLMPSLFAALAAFPATCIVALGLVQIGSLYDRGAWSGTIDETVFNDIVSGELGNVEKPSGIHYIATRSSIRILKEIEDNPILLEHFTSNRDLHDADSLLALGLALEKVQKQWTQALPIYIAAMKSELGSTEARWAAWSNVRRLLSNDDLADLNEALMTVSGDQHLPNCATTYEALLNKLDVILVERYSAGTENQAL